MANKPASQSQIIRKMLNKGVTVKDICRKLGVAPQTVYNVRYHMNKKRAAETGIKKLASKPAPKQIDEHATVAEPALQDLGKPLGLVQLGAGIGAIKEIPVPTKPTLWQRIKSFIAR